MAEHTSAAKSTTMLGLVKTVSDQNIKQLPHTLVLDVRLPRMGTQSFKALQKLVVGRGLILLHPPLADVEMTNALQTLLPLTERKLLKLKRWNQFMERRPF